MLIYYVVIAISFVLLYFAQIYDEPEVKVSKGIIIHKKKSNILFYSFVILLVIVAGFRYDVGADYTFYYYHFQSFAQKFYDTLVNFDEPGIRFVAYIVKIFSNNPAVFMFICSLIIIFIILFVSKRHSTRLLEMGLLFIFTGRWDGSFNGIRQYMAMAILMCGYTFLRDKHFFKWVVIVFFAFLFHKTALVMLPIFFIVRNRITITNILFELVISIILLFSYDRIFNSIGFLMDTSYSSNNSAYISNAMNIISVCISIAPAIVFVFLFYGKDITKEQTFLINMLLINGLSILVASQSAFLGRVGIYTGMFNIIAIPELCKNIDKKFSKILIIGIIVLYAISWLYRTSNDNSLNNFQWIWQIN